MYGERSPGPPGIFGITSPTSIIITKVSEGFLAAGKVGPSDLLIGAGSTDFKDQTRKQLDDAIDEAESARGGGKLNLVLNAVVETNSTSPVSRLINHFGCLRRESLKRSNCPTPPSRSSRTWAEHFIATTVLDHR